MTAYLQDPAAFAETQQSIAEDPRLAQDIDEAALIEREALTTAMLSTDAGFTFNNSGRVVHYDISADHTGFLTTDTHNIAMTWAVEGKGCVSPTRIRSKRSASIRKTAWVTAMCARLKRTT